MPRSSAGFALKIVMLPPEKRSEEIGFDSHGSAPSIASRWKDETTSRRVTCRQIFLFGSRPQINAAIFADAALDRGSRNARRAKKLVRLLFGLRPISVRCDNHLLMRSRS